MKKISFSDPLNIFLAAAAVLVVTVVALRFTEASKPTMQAKPEMATSANPQASSTGSTVQPGLPEPTSAVFSDGDALKALGPNWSFIRQEDQKTMNASFIDGTAPNRESIVQLIGKPQVGLDIEESNIVNQKLLDKALAQKDIQKAKVAGRAGYLVPMGSLEGGNAFVLTGSSTILILQDTQTVMWPAEPDPEVATYIAAVRVP